MVMYGNALWCMVMYEDVCWRMLVYAYAIWCIVMDGDVWWDMVIAGDVC